MLYELTWMHSQVSQVQEQRWLHVVLLYNLNEKNMLNTILINTLFKQKYFLTFKTKHFNLTVKVQKKFEKRTSKIL